MKKPHKTVKNNQERVKQFQIAIACETMRVAKVENILLLFFFLLPF